MAQKPYTPTPEQMDKALRKIRAGWDRVTEMRRGGRSTANAEREGRVVKIHCSVHVTGDE